MQYANYNDFELLYLVREGSEQAQNILYHKYSILIHKLVVRYYNFGDKKEDLVQEGFMILYKCIKSFNPGLTISFFSYVLLSLNRHFSYLLKGDYFSRGIFLTDNIQAPDGNNYYQYSFLKRGYYFLKEDIDILLYQECLLEGLSLKAFSAKYGLSYQKVYLKRKVILEDLKKILTN